MKKVLVCALGLALVAMSVPAFATCGCGKVWDDLSWWAQSGATPGPVKDAVRSGYWWWPTEAASNADDAELWGNRGVVYGMYAEKPKEEVKKIVEPEKKTPPPVKREKPVLNNVLFDFDKSTIRKDAEPVLGEVVNWMKKYEKDTLQIEGHTCNVGEEAYNMGLGQRRADSVKKWLVGQGIAETRLSTVSYGETKPVSPESNATPESRKQNRRAVFVFTLAD